MVTRKPVSLYSCYTREHNCKPPTDSHTAHCTSYRSPDHLQCKGQEQLWCHGSDQMAVSYSFALLQQEKRLEFLHATMWHEGDGIHKAMGNHKEPECAGLNIKFHHAKPFITPCQFHHLYHMTHVAQHITSILKLVAL